MKIYVKFLICLGAVLLSAYLQAANTGHGLVSGKLPILKTLPFSTTNDVMAAATVVPHTANWCSGQAVYQNSVATADGALGSCSSPYANVWFKFQATSANVHIELKTGDTEGSMSYPILGLWDDASTQLDCRSAISRYGDLSVGSINLTVGNWYYISVDNMSYDWAKGTFTLCIDDQPSYDFKEGAVEISNISNYCSGLEAYSNILAGPDQSGCNTPYANVWFKFQATTSFVDINLKTGGSEGTIAYPKMGLWDASGNALECREPVGRDEDLALGTNNLTVGAWYYLGVDNLSYDWAKGSFTLCINDQPSNDFKEGAIEINNISNYCSPLASLNNYHGGADQQNCVYTSPAANVWYKFQATTQYINIAMKTEGAEGTIEYPNMALWDESGNNIICRGQISKFTDLEMASNSLTVGDWYYISVDNNPTYGVKGTFTLCVDDQPTFDFKEGAITLTDISDYCSSDQAFSNLQASADGQSCAGTNANVWFKFQATTEFINVDLKTGGSHGQLSYPNLSLWDGSGNQLDCKDYTSKYADLHAAAENLTIGDWYYMAIDCKAPFGVKGTFTICVDDQPSNSQLPPPAKPELVACIGCDGYLKKDANDNNPDYSYFWQSQATGTDETHAAATFQPTESGTYYLRAKYGSFWSNASEGVEVTIFNEQPTGVANKPVQSTQTLTDRTVTTTQTIPENYLRTYTVMKEGIVDATVLNMDTDKDSVQISTSYVDGLGRPVQTVIKNGAPEIAGKNQQDIVQAIVYDDLGRQTKEFLPFASETTNGQFTTTALQAQYDFYRDPGNTNKVVNTGLAYSEKVLEASPLNKVLEEYAPGESWVGTKEAADPNQKRNITFEHRSNLADEILLWELDANGLPVQTGHYMTGEIMVSQTSDEHHHLTLEYQNKTGQVLLKKVQDGENAGVPTYTETYYLYDDWGNLRYVLPPAFMDAYQLGMETTDVAGFESLLDQFSFQYQYDHRKRMISKKVPGSGVVHLIYDKLDRLIMTQDAEQKEDSLWSFTKYDKLGRPVMTGLHHSILPPDQLRGWISYANHPLFEERTDVTNQAGIEGYTNQAYPTLDETNEIFTVSYYDTYDFKEDGTAYSYDPSFDSQFSGQQEVALSVEGQMTGSKVKNLKTGEWLTTVTFYNDKYRILQTQADNHKGGQDILTSAYDFSGQVIKTVLQHNNSAATHQILKTFAYDHGGRLLEVKQNIDNQAEDEVITQNEYNTLGEVIQKKLGTDVQTVDYKYNIRGWMTDINDVNNLGVDDVFAMQLSYEHGFEMGQYNGNISGQKWVTASDNTLRAYGYQYDALNRIKRADFRADDGSQTWLQEVDHFTVFDINYDKNGNILSLSRQGLRAINNGVKEFGAIDRLQYAYSGNKLIAVDDVIAANTKGLASDFYDQQVKYCLSNTNEYRYDDNGNLEKDDNKGIVDMEYNHLNLPKLIDFGGGKTIEYVYDAAGIKLQKIVNDNGDIKTTDYTGEFIYEDEQLQFIHHEEGRVVPKKINEKVTGDGFDYEYILKDHLGNARVTASDKELVYKATMEQTDLETEKRHFGNIEERQIIATGIGYNNSDAAALLPKGDIVTQEGPSKTMTVATGDSVTVSVWATYFSEGSSTSFTYGNTNINDPNGEGSNTNGSIVGSSITGGGAPNAYLKVEFIPDAGGNQPVFLHQLTQAPGTYQQLISAIEITEPGQLIIFTANESETDVLFDELEIRHQQKVVQENHYYAFGMQISGIEKETEEIRSINNFTYNGKELEKDFGLNSYSYGQRDYDPQLGRFNKIDRFSEKYYDLNPYQYTANNPISFIDVNGDSIDVSKLLTSTNGKLNIDGLYVLANILSDLSDLSGQNLGVKDGKIVNNGEIKGAKHSPKARAYINHLISMKGDMNINLTNGKTRGGGLGNTYINPDQIDNNIASMNAAGLDERTHGFGTSFLHESLHTVNGTSFYFNPYKAGHIHRDPRSYPNPKPITGETVDKVNEFRAEMGFATRSAYNLTGPSLNNLSRNWSKGGNTVNVPQIKMSVAEKHMRRTKGLQYYMLKIAQ